jgi:uncharacterized protein YebE (UPF0316 family)
VSAVVIFEASSMAGLALVSVGLWTLRVALTARGRGLAGAAVAAVEASVFAVVFGSLVSELDRPARLTGYAFGVAIGTLMGITVDKRLAGGRSEVRVVVEGLDATLVEDLRQRGWPCTAMAADGLLGPVTIVFVAVDDHRLTPLLDDVRYLAPRAFWTVARIDDANPIELNVAFTQIGGRRGRPDRVRAGRTSES